MNARGEDERIVIAGAGPAGSSLAIRLARAGRDVLLIERAKFPRHKLCGEFISPECLGHFQELGVLDEMLAAGGDRITQTVFHSVSGKSAEVPSEWFGASAPSALGLSRAEMDHILLREAERSGAEVLQGTSVTRVHKARAKVESVSVSAGRDRSEIKGGIFVDATGRQRVLAKHLDPHGSLAGSRSTLVGFKAHFSGASIEPGTCEIYFFPGGYGGLSYVEGGLANHCFLIDAKKAREYGGDPDRITNELIFRNPRARAALSGAEQQFDWLAVAVDGFGPREPAPAENLFTVGDSGAFIDPFTGSGMLMALESSEILSGAILSEMPDELPDAYRNAHRQRFRKRLMLCSAMRRLSFQTGFSSTAVLVAGASSAVRRLLARNTRGSLYEPRS